MQSVLHTLVQAMQQLFLQHALTSHARMLQLPAQYKFAQLHHIAIDADLADYLSDTCTGVCS